MLIIFVGHIGPSAIFYWDKLHNLDGVIEYFTKMLEPFFPKLIEKSEAHGNLAVLTKSNSMHIMEKAVESFHLVTLTVWLWKCDSAVSEDVKECAFRGCCALLTILALLNDCCFALVKVRLKAALEELSSQIVFFIGLKPGGSDKGLTSKMHELLKHALEQIEKMRLAFNTTCKPMEKNHRPVVQSYLNSSKRDGKSSKELLTHFLYRFAVQEASRGTTYFSPSLPFDTEADFHVTMTASNVHKTNKAMLVANCKHLSSYFGLDLGDAFVSEIMESNNVSSAPYGNTVYFQLKCCARNSSMTPVRHCVVPGTGKTFFTSNKVENVLVYKDSLLTNAVLQGLPRPGIELYCSSALDGNSKCGLPIMFFARHALVLSLFNKGSVSGDQSNIVQEFVTTPIAYEWVSYSDVRGTYMMSWLGKSCAFVFKGREVFGYDDVV